MKKHILILLCLISMTNTFAQDNKELPGNKSLPSSTEELQKLADLETAKYDYTVEDYFQKPKQSTFRFSPNGMYLSYREKDADGKSHVFVKNTKTDEIKRAIEEKDDLIRGYGWANDNRLIYVMDKGGDENYHLFAADLDGKNNMDLTPYEGVKVSILNNLKDHKDHMIIEMNKNNPSIFEPYKVNIVNGDLEQLYENKDAANPIAGYDFDKDGNLKAYTQQENGTEYVIYYRTGNDQPFEKVIRVTWRDSFSIIGFDYESDNPNDAYVMTNLENNTNEIILYDFAAKKTIKKIISKNCMLKCKMSLKEKALALQTKQTTKINT